MSTGADGPGAGRFERGGASYAYLTVSTGTIGAAGRLTTAERDIADRVARGASNSEIAKARGTGISTVANQLKSIYEKLGVASRYELVAALAGDSESWLP